MDPFREQIPPSNFAWRRYCARRATWAYQKILCDSFQLLDLCLKLVALEFNLMEFVAHSP